MVFRFWKRNNQPGFGQEIPTKKVRILKYSIVMMWLKKLRHPTRMAIRYSMWTRKDILTSS
jgi:hypothetical protein